MSLEYYLETLPRLVRENGGKLLATDFERAVESAVVQYSLDAPRRLVRDVTWPTTGYFTADLPAELTEDSPIYGAEYPIGSVPVNTVHVAQHVTEGPLQLLCEALLPGGAVVRVTFGGAHQLVGGTTPVDTIPTRHRDAVLHYAAHLLCREMATLFSGEIDSAIAADGSNTESRARNYAQRAKDYRASYYAQIGVADPMAKAAGGGSSQAAGSATAAAGAVGSWPSRRRPSWRTNDGFGGV